MSRWALSPILPGSDPLEALSQLVTEQNLILAEIEQFELQVKGQGGYEAQIAGNLNLQGGRVRNAGQSVHDADYITRAESRDFGVYSRENIIRITRQLIAGGGISVPPATEGSSAVPLDQINAGLGAKAPVDAVYITGASNTVLTAERVVTDTDTIKWDLTTAAQAKVLIKRIVIGLLVSDPLGADLTTGDGKVYFRVPSIINGWNLVAVAAAVATVSSVGIPTFQVRRVRAGSPVDMLSTKLTVDATELDSSTAATPAVIDTSNDDVATADQIHIDCDVAGTGTKGPFVELQFEKP